MGVVPAVVFLGVGLAFAALGFQQLAEARRFARGACRAPGVVVDMQARRAAFRSRRRWRWRPSEDVLFFPVVRFRPPGGKEVTFQSATGTNPPQFRAGRQVSVIYDPQNPSTARVESFLSSTAFPVFMAALGLIFAALGAVLLATWR